MEKYLKEIARFKKTKSIVALGFIVSTIMSGIRKDTGWNYFQILSDFFSTRKLLKVNFHEYFLYRLYDQKKPDQYRMRFAGRVNRDAFLERINPAAHILLARNKYVTKLLLKSLEIPTPEMYFLYDPQAGVESPEVLNNHASAEKRLSRLGSRPFVVKVLEGEHGRDVNVYGSYEIAHNEFRAFHVSGETHSLSQVLDFAGKGHKLLVEEKVVQNASFSALNQTSVNTIRMLTQLHPNGEADLILAFIRIGRQGRWVDNAGKGGNVMAKVNKETGRLENIISFINYRTFEPITHHPDSGVNLVDFEIRDWKLILEQVLGFQRKISWLKAIGWDIAITDNGPMVIEINNRWDVVGQSIGNEGWLDYLETLDREWMEAPSN